MGREKTKKIIVSSIITIFVLIVTIYTGFEIRRYVTGPEIKITSPLTGSLTNESLIEITGKAINISEVKVNDNKIYMDEEGNFTQKVLLSTGYNVLKVSGVDKFQRETEQILEVTYKK
jgi:hypothetical protein